MLTPATSTPLPSTSPVARPVSHRLRSLDALRGFDMFWILGADEIVYGLRKLKPSPVTDFIATQLDHAEWAGFHFYDLIFPLFVFITGVALVFSLRRTVAQHGRAAAMQRILLRSALLFAFGIFYNGGLSSPWPDVRLLGVLQRIAIAYAGAGILFVFLKPRALAITGVALLGVYWALLTFVPIRDVPLEPHALAAKLGADAGAKAMPHHDPSPAYVARVRQALASTPARVTGRYDPGLNLTNHVDFAVLPGRLYDHYWDPEGLLSSIPAIATCLCGVFAGLVLAGEGTPQVKLRTLLVGAAVALVLGFAWSAQFPLIKKIWTSSFVLVAAGWSTLLLAAFYYVVEMRGWRRWCTMFVWIGMNPITLYLAKAVIAFHGIARRVVGGDVQQWFDTTVTPGFGDLVVAATSLALVVALARFLYARQIFLRV